MTAVQALSQICDPPRYHLTMAGSRFAVPELMLHQDLLFEYIRRTPEGAFWWLTNGFVRSCKISLIMVDGFVP